MSKTRRLSWAFLHSSYPVWESCIFPMREQQIFLAFFSVHPHLIKQICAKNAFLDKTLTHLNTVQCYIIGQEKVVPFVSEKRFFRKRSHMWETRTIEYHTKRMSLLSTSQIRKKERRKKSHTGSRSSLYLCITSSRCPCHLYFNFEVFFVNETKQRKTSCVNENSVDDDL